MLITGNILFRLFLLLTLFYLRYLIVYFPMNLSPTKTWMYTKDLYSTYNQLNSVKLNNVFMKNIENQNRKLM